MLIMSRNKIQPPSRLRSTVLRKERLSSHGRQRRLRPQK